MYSVAFFLIQDVELLERDCGSQRGANSANPVWTELVVRDVECNQRLVRRQAAPKVAQIVLELTEVV